MLLFEIQKEGTGRRMGTEYLRSKASCAAAALEARTREIKGTDFSKACPGVRSNFYVRSCRESYRGSIPKMTVRNRKPLPNNYKQIPISHAGGKINFLYRKL